MKIAITGGSGFVGKELVRLFSTRHDVLALTHQALDITDGQAVRRVMTGERPDLIINCAVLGADDCEANPALAQAVNIEGARFLAEAAAEIDAEILHFSTNYVFDGKREAGSLYTIHDTALPINRYGETKLAGELAVRKAAQKSYIVRTSWVFGPGQDNFFSAAVRTLKARARLRAVNDTWASVTYVADLAARVDEILARRRYATYQVVNGGVCSRAEFALEVARELEMTGAEMESLIEPISEAEVWRPALRPRYTPMRCLVSEELGLVPMRPWQAALSDYIDAIRS